MGTEYFVYMLASDTRQLYIGITNDLVRRLLEHRSGTSTNSYSYRHETPRLVYFEMTPDVRSAIQREKQLKRYHRRQSFNLSKE
jgi:putative endonuclease